MLPLPAAVKHCEHWRVGYRTNGKLMAIRELLEGEPICLEIVCDPIRHGGATDAPRDSAEWWWINADIPGATDLGRLQELGVVHSHHVQDSISVYPYTKNPLLHESLCRYVDDRLSGDRFSTVQAGSR
jgi:hypothetical protein